MVKHIVMWKLKEAACGRSKGENAILIKKTLEELPSKIEQIIKLEVGIDFAASETSCDVVLYSEFATKEDLAAYIVHPDHKAVGPFVKEVTCARLSADYEC